MSEERKLVTVLFADIVGSTALGAHDPEVVRESMSRTFTRVHHVLVAHGGTVEKFIGDAVMAVFGIPRSHEDDAERAVRAAFAIRDALAELNARASPALDLRIGLNSGEVVTGTGEGGGFLVTGRPVNLASRLQEAAAPGEILVGPLTRRLTETEVRYGPSRRIQAKGIGEVEVAPALETLSARPSPRREARRRAPLVDREAELATLVEAYRRVAQRRRPHLVVVYGDAGAGKSRLALELIDRVGSDRVRRGHCAAYGEAVTYLPFEQILRADAGVTALDSAEEAARKVRDAAAATLGGDEDAEAIVRRLLLLAGVQIPGGVADIPSESLPQELRWGIVSYLGRRAASEPLVLVLEDLHWAEPPLLDAIDHLVDRGSGALLVLCQARPELLPTRPSWVRARPNATSLFLEPLSPAQTRELVGELLPPDLAGRGVGEEIAARAEGNPLFVEEFVRSFVERRELPVSPPESLQGLIAARLDGTDPAVRALLRRASVIGRIFWTDALVALGEDATRVRERLTEAERRDFVVELDERGPGGGWSYRFKHVLVRDVAYATVSKAERAQLHDHLSRWLEEIAGSRGAERSEVAAYHAEQAYLLARQVGLESATPLGRRAFAQLVAAAHDARERGDHHATRALFDRAVSVGEAADVDAAQLVAPRGYAATSRLRLEATPEAVAAVDRALAGARRYGASGVLVSLLTWRAMYALYESVDLSRGLHDEAVGVARGLRDEQLVAYALWASAEPDAYTGDLDQQLRILEEAHRLLAATSAGRILAQCVVNLAENAILRGDFGLARAKLDEAASLARERRGVARFLVEEATARCAHAVGDDEEAVLLADGALGLAKELGAPLAIARACATLGSLLRQSGAADRARSVLEEGLAAAQRAAQQPFTVRLLANLARAYLALGDLGAARSHAEEANRLTSTDVAIAVEASASYAAVRDAEGDPREAEALLRGALSLVERTQLRAVIAELRRELGELLMRHGRGREAQQQLAAVVDFYGDPLAVRRREEAQALLRRATAVASA